MRAELVPVRAFKPITISLTFETQDEAEVIRDKTAETVRMTAGHAREINRLLAEKLSEALSQTN